MDQYGRPALAFKTSAGDQDPELVLRYKTRAERSYHRSLQAIKQIATKPPMPAMPDTTGRNFRYCRQPATATSQAPSPTRSTSL